MEAVFVTYSRQFCVLLTDNIKILTWRLNKLFRHLYLQFNIPGSAIYCIWSKPVYKFTLKFLVELEIALRMALA